MKLVSCLAAMFLVTGPFAGLLYQSPSFILHGYTEQVPVAMPLGNGHNDFQILGTLTPDKDIVLTHFDVYAKGAAVSFVPPPINKPACGTTIIVNDFTELNEAAIYLPGDPNPTTDMPANHFASADILPPLLIKAGDQVSFEAHSELSCQFDASKLSVNVQYRAH